MVVAPTLASRLQRSRRRRALDARSRSTTAPGSGSRVSGTSPQPPARKKEEIAGA